MNDYTKKVRDYLLELELDITHEDENEGIFVVQNEMHGITNLILSVSHPILIIEQYIFKLQNPSEDIYRDLLKKNRDIIHGAFVLDEEGNKVIFRDTLQIETLDLIELESSINSLSLLLSEYSKEIIQFSKY